MSDNAYLLVLAERKDRIDFDLIGGDGAERIALYAPFHVPLLWLALFSEADVQPGTEDAFRALELSSPVSRLSCVAEVGDAVARLHARQPFLSALYAAEGGVAHHVELFAGYLQGLGAAFVALDITELAAQGGSPSVLGLRQLLSRLDREEAGVRGQLDEWSTFEPGVRLITLEQGRGCTAEEMHNYFRVMGSGYSDSAPWD